MNIQQINSIYQSKVTEIKQRLPQTDSIQTKFQDLLEQTQLKNTINMCQPQTTQSTTETDPVKLINSLMATQSSINATSALYGSSDSNSAFPTSSLNNSFMALQQTALLKAINNNSEE